MSTMLEPTKTKTENDTIVRLRLQSQSPVDEALQTVCQLVDSEQQTLKVSKTTGRLKISSSVKRPASNELNRALNTANRIITPSNVLALVDKQIIKPDPSVITALKDAEATIQSLTTQFSIVTNPNGWRLDLPPVQWKADYNDTNNNNKPSNDHATNHDSDSPSSHPNNQPVDFDSEHGSVGNAIVAVDINNLLESENVLFDETSEHNPFLNSLSQPPYDNRASKKSKKMKQMGGTLDLHLSSFESVIESRSNSSSPQSRLSSNVESPRRSTRIPHQMNETKQKRQKILAALKLKRSTKKRSSVGGSGGGGGGGGSDDDDNGKDNDNDNDNDNDYNGSGNNNGDGNDYLNKGTSNGKRRKINVSKTPINCLKCSGHVAVDTLNDESFVTCFAPKCDSGGIDHENSKKKCKPGYAHKKCLSGIDDTQWFCPKCMLIFTDFAERLGITTAGQSGHQLFQLINSNLKNIDAFKAKFQDIAKNDDTVVVIQPLHIILQKYCKKYESAKFIKKLFEESYSDSNAISGLDNNASTDSSSDGTMHITTSISKDDGLLPAFTKFKDEISILLIMEQYNAILQIITRLSQGRSDLRLTTFKMIHEVLTNSDIPIQMKQQIVTAMDTVSIAFNDIERQTKSDEQEQENLVNITANEIFQAKMYKQSILLTDRRILTDKENKTLDDMNNIIQATYNSQQQFANDVSIPANAMADVSFKLFSNLVNEFYSCIQDFRDSNQNGEGRKTPMQRKRKLAQRFCSTNLSIPELYSLFHQQSHNNGSRPLNVSKVFYWIAKVVIESSKVDYHILLCDGRLTDNVTNDNLLYNVFDNPLGRSMTTLRDIFDISIYDTDPNLPILTQNKRWLLFMLHLYKGQVISKGGEDYKSTLDNFSLSQWQTLMPLIVQPSSGVFNCAENGLQLNLNLNVERLVHIINHIKNDTLTTNIAVNGSPTKNKTMDTTNEDDNDIIAIDDDDDDDDDDTHSISDHSDSTNDVDCHTTASDEFCSRCSKRRTMRQGTPSLYIGNAHFNSVGNTTNTLVGVPALGDGNVEFTALVPALGQIESVEVDADDVLFVLNKLPDVVFGSPSLFLNEKHGQTNDEKNFANWFYQTFNIGNSGSNTVTDEAMSEFQTLYAYKVFGTVDELARAVKSNPQMSLFLPKGAQGPRSTNLNQVCNLRSTPAELTLRSLGDTGIHWNARIQFTKDFHHVVDVIDLTYLATTIKQTWDESCKFRQSNKSNSTSDKHIVIPDVKVSYFKRKIGNNISINANHLTSIHEGNMSNNTSSDVQLYTCTIIVKVISSDGTLSVEIKSNTQSDESINIENDDNNMVMDYDTVSVTIDFDSLGSSYLSSPEPIHWTGNVTQGATGIIAKFPNGVDDNNSVIWQSFGGGGISPSTWRACDDIDIGHENVNEHINVSENRSHGAWFRQRHIGTPNNASSKSTTSPIITAGSSICTWEYAKVLSLDVSTNPITGSALHGSHNDSKPVEIHQRVVLGPPANIGGPRVGLLGYDRVISSTSDNGQCSLIASSESPMQTATMGRLETTNGTTWTHAVLVFGGISPHDKIEDVCKFPIQPLGEEGSNKSNNVLFKGGSFTMTSDNDNVLDEIALPITNIVKLTNVNESLTFVPPLITCFGIQWTLLPLSITKCLQMWGTRTNDIMFTYTRILQVIGKLLFVDFGAYFYEYLLWRRNNMINGEHNNDHSTTLQTLQLYESGSTNEANAILSSLNLQIIDDLIKGIISLTGKELTRNCINLALSDPIHALCGLQGISDGAQKEFYENVFWNGPMISSTLSIDDECSTNPSMLCMTTENLWNSYDKAAKKQDVERDEYERHNGASLLDLVTQTQSHIENSDSGSPMNLDDDDDDNDDEHDGNKWWIRTDQNGHVEITSPQFNDNGDGDDDDDEARVKQALDMANLNISPLTIVLPNNDEKHRETMIDGKRKYYFSISTVDSVTSSSTVPIQTGGDPRQMFTRITSTLLPNDGLVEETFVNVDPNTIDDMGDEHSTSKYDLYSSLTVLNNLTCGINMSSSLSSSSVHGAVNDTMHILLTYYNPPISNHAHEQLTSFMTSLKEYINNVTVKDGTVYYPAVVMNSTALVCYKDLRVVTYFQKNHQKFRYTLLSDINDPNRKELVEDNTITSIQRVVHPDELYSLLLASVLISINGYIIPEHAKKIDEMCKILITKCWKMTDDMDDDGTIGDYYGHGTFQQFDLVYFWHLIRLVMLGSFATCKHEFSCQLFIDTFRRYLAHLKSINSPLTIIFNLLSTTIVAQCKLLITTQCHLILNSSIQYHRTDEHWKIIFNAMNSLFALVTLIHLTSNHKTNTNANDIQNMKTFLSDAQVEWIKSTLQSSLPNDDVNKLIREYCASSPIIF